MKRGFTGTKPKPKKTPSIYEDFIPSSKAKRPGIRRHSDVQPSSLNTKQREVFDLVDSHVREGRDQLLALVLGCGGTGKSHIIHSLRPLFEKHKKRYRIFSFTGSSAFNIGGSTFHNGMKLPYFLRASQPNTNLNAAKRELKGVSYLIIDEISLVGKFMLGMVSERLKLVFGNDEPFGGISVIALGDFSQSRPVADMVLYSSNENCEGIEKAGGIAYRCFTKAIFLDEMMRQGPAEADFRQTLLRIRKGKLSEDDLKLMAGRVANQIPVEQYKAFVEEGTALFAEHLECDKYNNFRLENLPSKIVDIPSKHTRCTGKIGPQVLRLAVGAKVILTKNLWTEQGLYNGALGEVTEIGPLDPVKHVPTHIFVKFQEYYGPRFLMRDDIPLVMTESSEFTSAGETFTRIQFPIMLAFGVTIHKSQGCTLKKITIGVPTGNRSLLIRNAPSMFYVALSRVRRACDFVLTREFRRDLVEVKYKCQLDWMEEEERLKQMEIDNTSNLVTALKVKMPNKIQKQYLNPLANGSFSGLPAFVKSRGYSNYSKIKDDLQALEAYSLFKRIRLKYPHRKTRVFWDHYQYGVDLMQITDSMSAANSNIKFILICVDNFSRYLRTAFLKSKSGPDVARGLAKILRESKHYPRYVLADLGPEFYNSSVSALFAKHNIKLFSVHSTMKSSIAEKTIFKLRKLLARAQEHYKSDNFTKIWKHLVRTYNNTPHSTTGYAPSKSNAENAVEIWNNIYRKTVLSKPKPLEFKVGDRVRISKAKLHIFVKSSASQLWTSEIFVIDKAFKSVPNFYRLKDLNNEEVIGSFLAPELQKIPN